MKNIFQIIGLCLILINPGSVFSQDKISELVYGEAEISLDIDSTRITIFIVNNSQEKIRLSTGSHGGSGRNDDRQIEGVGTGITALPELLFENKNKYGIKITAPQLQGYITIHHMRPYFTEIESNKRVKYYSFEVPKSQVEGKFISGEIKFPEGYIYEGGKKEIISSRTIPILKAAKIP